MEATQASIFETTQKRIAVVTGANKGIGLEVCRQLAAKGVKVLLTARDVERGTAALKKLHEEGASDVVFHQLDVADSASVASLADYIRAHFGRLDILVNNAAVGGVELEPQALTASNQLQVAVTSLVDMILATHEKAEECININYYGTKRMCKLFIPLLQLSQSPKIINLSSTYGKLQCIPSENIRKEMANVNNLTEEKIDGLVESFLNDFREEKLKENGWPTMLSAYKVSKVAVSAYTRILAKEYPAICINCVHPGVVKTDINWNTGPLTVEEGAKGAVMLALLPDDSPSVSFFMSAYAQRSYDGVKRVTEALIPFLLLSQSPRTVNVSSSYGKLQLIPNENVQQGLGNMDSLSEEKLDNLVQSFLNDLK